MNRPRGFRRLLVWPRRDRARIRADVDEEIAFHLEMRVRELVERGRSVEAAREQAEREFGDLAEAREALMSSDAYEERRRRWSNALGDALRDVRLTARGLARAPLFTAVAVSTLGLGIGANTALFSLIDGVVLKPLPYPDAEQLAAVPSDMFMRGEFVQVRERARSYEQLAGYGLDFAVGIAMADEPLQVSGVLTSFNLLETLGVAPAFGRGFGPEHEKPGSDEVVLLSHGLAAELFGEPASAVGRKIVANGVTRTVIGVVPSSFAFPTSQTRIWLPFTFDPANINLHWGGYWIWLVGRLHPGGISEQQEQARQELVTLMAQLRLENPLWTPQEPYRADVNVEPLADRIVGDARTPLLLLLCATAFVLLIACANVGNLSMVRIAARERDFAVRAALGGGPKQILRTVTLEGLVLATCGGAVGVALAYAGLRAVLPFLPADTPRLDQVAIDGRVLGFALVAILVAALLFSLLPAARALGGGLRGALQEGGRGASESRRMRRVSRAVVIGEMALAVVLLLGASLLFRSLAALYAIDPGFRSEGVTAARVSAGNWQLPDSAARLAFYGRILERVGAAPGVRSAAVTSQLPFDGALSLSRGRCCQVPTAIEHVRMDPNDLPVFDFRPISPDYFHVLGMPVLAGRAFTTADQQGALPVAIVDEIAAQRFWPGESAIGERVGGQWSDEWLTIVGVVPTAKNGDLTSEPLPALYVSFAQHPTMSSATIVIRADRPAGELAPIIRSAVREAHPDVPVAEVRALDALVRESASDSRAVTWLLSAFAGVALLLGALGIYGVLAFSVQRRTREIGVRLALGARPAEVRALVLRDGAGLIALGIALGVPLALLLGRALHGLLYGVATTDPVSLVVAPAVLGVAGLLAAFLPALRASRVDPASTLRSEC